MVASPLSNTFIYVILSKSELYSKFIHILHIGDKIILRYFLNDRSTVIS